MMFRRNSTRRVPLFPLNVVVFPGMPLPLHIFEPRYQTMVRHCLEGDHHFGVCLIRSGEEVGETAEPHAIGTLCEIVAASPLEEGRVALLTLGRQRFRVHELFRDQPYLEARIETLEEEPVGDLGSLVPEMQEAVRRQARLLMALRGEEEREIRCPDDPVRLSYLAGSLLQAPLTVRQDVLEMQQVGPRLRRELDLLAAETAILVAMKEKQTKESGKPQPFKVRPEEICPN
jgi:Lon protease-like protein